MVLNDLLCCKCFKNASICSCKEKTEYQYVPSESQKLYLRLIKKGFGISQCVRDNNDIIFIFDQLYYLQNECFSPYVRYDYDTISFPIQKVNDVWDWVKTIKKNEVFSLCKEFQNKGVGIHKWNYSGEDIEIVFDQPYIISSEYLPLSADIHFCNNIVSFPKKNVFDVWHWIHNIKRDEIISLEIQLTNKGLGIVCFDYDPQREKTIIEFNQSYFQNTDGFPMSVEYEFNYNRMTVLNKDISDVCDWAKHLERQSSVFEDRFNVTDINKEYGENLVKFILMAYRGWNVETADEVGVDLIAIDTNVYPKQRYAIQVKLRHFVSDGETNSDFTFDSEIKLRKFVDEISFPNAKFIPMVAYVNINRDQSVNVIMANLNDLSELRENGNVGINASHDGDIQTGYICNTNTKRKQLFNREEISYYRYSLTFTNREHSLNIVKRSNHLETYEQYKELKRQSKRKENDEDSNELENKTELKAHDKYLKGNYGEWCYMLRSWTRGNKPILVRSVGVDVLEIRDSGMVAVSVKTFSKEQEDIYTFEQTNIDNMNTFCEKWDIANKKVVLQFLIYDNKKGDGKKYKSMYVFEMDLDYLTKKRCEYLYYTTKKDAKNPGYTLNWKTDTNAGINRLDLIKKDPNIIFKEIFF